MVELTIRDLLLIIAGGLIGHLAYGKFLCGKIIARLKKENARLRDMTSAQDRALKIAAAKIALCDSKNGFHKPLTIITTEIEIVKGGVRDGK